MLIESKKMRHIDSLTKIYLYTNIKKSCIILIVDFFFTFRVDDCFNLSEKNDLNFLLSGRTGRGRVIKGNLDVSAL